MGEARWVVRRKTEDGEVAEGVFVGPEDGVLMSISIRSPKTQRMASVKRIDKGPYQEKSPPLRSAKKSSALSRTSLERKAAQQQALRKRAERVEACERFMLDIRELFNSGKTEQECARLLGTTLKKVRAAIALDLGCE